MNTTKKRIPSKFTKLSKSEKVLKYETELVLNLKITNDFTLKKDAKGKNIPLTKRDKSYRVGFLNALK